LQGFKYAGAQNGSTCSCGNSYGSLGTSTSCTVACSGDSLRACGGTLANIVIYTGLSKQFTLLCLITTDTFLISCRLCFMLCKITLTQSCPDIHIHLCEKLGMSDALKVFHTYKNESEVHFVLFVMLRKCCGY
jgi:WSC domain